MTLKMISATITCMVISYYGGECFKVSFGDTTLAFNPISKKSALKAPSFGADIALVSINHPDMNGIEQVTRGDKEPFVVDGPGAYEIKDVAVRGVETTSSYGGKSLINTSYLVSLEGMSLCFLGALDSKELPSELKEMIDVVDILFVPIGGDGVLEPKDAHQLGVKLEAKIVIPMHYTTKAAGEIGEKDALKTFLKEEGKEQAKTLDKLSIKRKDLDGTSGQVTVLAS